MAGASPASRADRSPAHNNNNNTDYIPDVKQRLPPPPDAEHPAIMTYAARPLSMPGPDGLDPVFPVSPLSAEGEPFAAGGSSSSSSKRRSSSSSSSSPTGPTFDSSAAGGAGAGAAAAAAGLSLARQQSINSGGRAQLVRVGSEKARQQQQEKSSADPLAMNPVVHTEPEWRLFPTTTKEVNIPVQPQPQPPTKDDRYVAGRTAMPLPVPVDHGTPSPLLVQAPVPRRPVDPFSLEQGTAW